MLKRIRLFWVFLGSALVLSFSVGAWSAVSHQPKTSESRINLASFATLHGITIPAGLNSTTFTSPLLEPQLPGNFDVAGLEWQGTLPTGTHIQFWLQDASGAWLTAPLVGEESKESSEVNTFYTQPIAFDSNHTRFKLELTRDSVQIASPVVRDVQLITVDSGQSSTSTRTLAASSVNVISREEWGADEAYRFTSDGTELWPADYQTPTKFIIHHTAGGTGGTDPAATVRAIYYWHAVVLGWGDIGYNYLVDESGNIYQGRYGDEGVVGAHAYNDVREINYNAGSIGIALLGCYEADDDGACSSISTPSDQMFTSLTNLIGTKGRSLNIRPKHRATLFHDIEISNVVGHRDVDYTLCPGSILHDNLSQIKSAAQSVYNGFDPAFRGKFIQSDLPTSVASDADFNLTTTWKNTGTKAWNQQSVYLKVYNSSGHHPTRLGNGKIFPLESSVAPGESATFVIPLHTLVENSTRNIILKVFHRYARISTATDPLSIITIQPRALSELTLNLPPAVRRVWRPQVTVTAINIGSEPIPAGATLLQQGQEVAKTEVSAAPGEQLTWSFVWIPPQKLGISQLEWSVESERLTISGSQLTTSLRIDR